MSDEDDYLSDKFLAPNAPSIEPQTYSQRRKQVSRNSQLRNEQNRIKNRRQRETEAREEGLRKSLFERAEEEEATSRVSSKALSIMMKMGFRPGDALGHQRDEDHKASSILQESRHIPGGKQNGGDRTEPLPMHEWAGRQGIGLGKRVRSPGATERLLKMVKMAEKSNHDDFRDRAQQEYRRRQAEGRLSPVQRTCEALDEKNEVLYNVLWLNPDKPESFPLGLIDALKLHSGSILALPPNPGVLDGDFEAARLRRQMQTDALQSLPPLCPSPFNDVAVGAVETEIGSSAAFPHEDKFSQDTLEEAAQFLRLQAQDRLQLVLSYLRDKYSYCFWCGVQYTDPEDMGSQCPGPSEDDHD